MQIFYFLCTVSFLIITMNVLRHVASPTQKQYKMQDNLAEWH